MSICNFILTCLPKKESGQRIMCLYGFTFATKSDGTQYPQCMLCNVNLCNSSVAPAKLPEHFTKAHGRGKYKDTTLNQFKQKRVRFDANATITSYGFVPVDKPILTASYEVAYLIAKQGKPHIIGETLVKPAAMQLAKVMLGKEAEINPSIFVYSL